MYRLLIIVLLSHFVGFSQDPYYVNYSIEEGLPTSNIYSAFEDSKGYMWFATDVGVLRFDGYSFKQFNTDDGLADNEIFKLFEDSKHRLWFLSLNGKLSYFKDGYFFNNKTTPFLELASYQKMAIDVSEDELGNIYFLYSNGFISTIDAENKVVHKKENNITSFSIWNVNKQQYILNKDYILNLETSTKFELDKNVITDRAYRFTATNNGTYFFSTGTSIYHFKNVGCKKVYDTNNKEVIHLNTIDNELWVGTRQGLLVKSKDSIRTYFEKDIISSVLKDSQGNFWVTTLNHGIKFIPNFSVFRYELNKLNQKVNALYAASNNRIWIGTQAGLFISQLDTFNEITFLKIPKIENLIKRIRNHDHGVFIIGTESIQYFKDSKRENYPFGAKDILFDNDYTYLAVFSVFKYKNEAFLAYKNKMPPSNIYNNDLNILLKRRTNRMIKGKAGVIYFGTTTGLYHYSNDELYKIKSLNEVLNTSILDLYYDEKSQLLFAASNSKGLIVLKNENIVNHITTQQKLNSNGCNSIKKIDDNNYLVGTNNGLNLLKFDGNAFQVLDVNSLLNIKKDKINAIEIINKDVYLGTDKGLVSFNIDKIKNHQHAPKIIIDKVLVNGLPNSNINNLEYKENNLLISYTGISYTDFGNLIYRYKFNNDTLWTETKSRQIDFKNLSHGNYKLELKVAGNNGVYSPAKAINFKIKPPFWKTIPFILFVSVTFSLILFYLVKKRINSIKKRFLLERKALWAEQEKAFLEKQTAELEQKALRLQMNPHFIFNALNTIKGYYSGGDIHEANRYINRFSKLLRLILENDDYLVSLDKEIEMLQLYLKLVQLRYQNIFDFKITVSKDIKREKIGIPPLLIQPIVENAIIHGIAPSLIKGKLNIDFYMENDYLVSRVIDNGIGIKASKINGKSNHKSKAIKITIERVQVINNSKNSNNFKIIEHEAPTGTEVIIRIPILKLW